MKILKFMLATVLLMATGWALADATTDAIIAFVQTQTAAGASAEEIAEALLDESATSDQEAAIESLVEQMINNPNAGESLAAQIISQAGGALNTATTGIPAPTSSDSAESDQADEADEADEADDSSESESESAPEVETYDGDTAEADGGSDASDGGGSTAPPPPPPPSGESDPSPF